MLYIVHTYIRPLLADPGLDVYPEKMLSHRRFFDFLVRLLSDMIPNRVGDQPGVSRANKRLRLGPTSALFE